jgi:UDP-glucose 4-epimerase
VQGRVEFTKNRAFYKGDIADETLLKKIFTEHPDIYATIHCAAIILVPESVEKPYEYYSENVSKSIQLFNNLVKLNCKRVVFSSSASIYDVVPNFMVTEEAPLKPSSPYARTKYMMEMILQDYCHAYPIKGIALRYFNPIGSDPKMRSGQYVQNPSHVLGRLVQTALGHISEFHITGTNWPTRDGSGIRDYIHVWDLALAHLKAVENFDKAFQINNKINKNSNYLCINLGTGNGVTVKELVSAFEKVYGKIIPKKETDPRLGDVAGAYANANRALELIEWKSSMTLEEAIQHALDYQRRKLH